MNLKPLFLASNMSSLRPPSRNASPTLPRTPQCMEMIVQNNTTRELSTDYSSVISARGTCLMGASHWYVFSDPIVTVADLDILTCQVFFWRCFFWRSWMKLLHGIHLSSEVQNPSLCCVLLRNPCAARRWNATTARWISLCLVFLALAIGARPRQTI